MAATSLVVAFFFSMCLLALARLLAAVEHQVYALSPLLAYVVEQVQEGRLHFVRLAVHQRHEVLQPRARAHAVGAGNLVVLVEELPVKEAAQGLAVLLHLELRAEVLRQMVPLVLAARAAAVLSQLVLFHPMQHPLPVLQREVGEVGLPGISLRLRQRRMQPGSGRLDEGF